MNDVPNHAGDPDHLPSFDPLMAAADYGILVEQISAAAADEVLAQSKRSLQSLVSEIDDELKPHSFVVSHSGIATMVVDLAREERQAHNVLGYWPGETDD